jgi:hypothetical protein
MEVLMTRRGRGSDLPGVAAVGGREIEFRLHRVDRLLRLAVAIGESALRVRSPCAARQRAILPASSAECTAVSGSGASARAGAGSLNGPRR